jgi:hypothetical protein
MWALILVLNEVVNFILGNIVITLRKHNVFFSDTAIVRRNYFSKRKYIVLLTLRVYMFPLVGFVDHFGSYIKKYCILWVNTV